MLGQAPVETCDCHIICLLEGDSLPFQKRPQIIFFEPLHYLPFQHEIAKQTFLWTSSYQKKQNCKYPSCGAFLCCGSNSLASSEKQMDVLLWITAQLQRTVLGDLMTYEFTASLLSWPLSWSMPCLALHHYLSLILGIACGWVYVLLWFGSPWGILLSNWPWALPVK